MKTSSKVLFMTMMLTSTIVVLNTNSWISMWIGLEMNLMSFIPLILVKKNPLNSQSIMMYFLIQSMASMMLMMTILTNKYMFTLMYENTIKMIIFLIMMIKMGMPPFHMWFPEMMNKISWKECLMLMTWQKIAPMYIISLIAFTNKWLISIVCLTAMIGAVGGLNQTSTRKIMAYSSINHMSWLVACATWFKKSWMMYMMMYTLMMVVIINMLNMYNIMFINQMNIFFKTMSGKVGVLLFMMSIGGLPPFFGFIPKWMTIQYMITSGEFIMLMVMVTCALITLSYYLRMSTSMNLILSHSQKWLTFSFMKLNILMWIFFTNMLLPTVILLMNFY